MLGDVPTEVERLINSSDYGEGPNRYGKRDGCVCFFFFFQAEDGIRDFWLSRGLGDVDKSQDPGRPLRDDHRTRLGVHCFLYTSDAADDLPCVNLGVCRITKKKISLSYSAH